MSALALNPTASIQVTDGSQTPKKSSRISAIISGIVIASILAIVAAVVLVPRLLGAVPLTVLTGSMTPTYQPGDIVVVQPVPVSELAVGDVVTFQPISGDPRLNTHRIVEITTDNGAITAITTRGDANNSNDPPILPEQIQGRVIYSVPFVGRFANPRGATMAIITLVGGALILYAVTSVYRGLITDKRTKSNPEA